MNRIVVNVATGRYVAGQARLMEALQAFKENYYCWTNELPEGSPTHETTPYAFKSFALEAMRKRGHTLLLWADASIVPIRTIDPIWAHAETHGVWMSDNGSWKNNQWTCDAAYRDLFAAVDVWESERAERGTDPMEDIRRVNSKIKHVVATAFAIDVMHPKGAQFLSEYLRLAKTNAFKGPWWNSNGERPDYASKAGAEPCGPPECLGHRHDQAAASVIAWRLGIPLTQSPKFFTYDGQQTDETILIAKGI